MTDIYLVSHNALAQDMCITIVNTNIVACQPGKVSMNGRPGDNHDNTYTKTLHHKHETIHISTELTEHSFLP